jgi:hypothetical protein
MPRLRPSLVGKPAVTVSGVSVDGEPSSYEPGPGRSVLVFLTSSCQPCLTIWSSLAAERPPDVVAVTPDSATENRRAVAALAGQARVVMSSDGWLAYGVSKAPWAVVIEDGMVVADGPADSGLPPGN